MDEDDLDVLLKVLSNTTRRKILAKLAQERHYPLQLSKELRISQQAITKHLRVLEEHGIVECVTVRSVEGPPRKLYRTTRKFTVSISMDPRMFDARGREPTEAATPIKDEEMEELEGTYRDILHTQNYKDRLRRIGLLLSATEEDLEALYQRRMLLLGLKSKILKEATSLIAELYPDYSHRAALYTLLEDPSIDMRGLARELNMSEDVVEELVEELAQDDVIPRDHGVLRSRERRSRRRRKAVVRKGR